MRDLKRFWRSLETLIGLATVAEHWRRLIGEEYTLARHLLRPSGDLARFFPHDDPDVCVYRVVTHAPDDHVGICDQTGERVALRTEHLVLHELDRRALAGDLARAFRFTAQQAHDQPRPGLIGHFEPLAGYRFPVLLIIPSPGVDLAQTVCRLAATQSEPFVLFVPTAGSIGAESEQLLRQRGACLLPLVEATLVDADGRLAASQAGRAALEQFRRRVVPEAEQPIRLAFFPTPAGASWADVKIHLLDGHTVSVAVSGVHGVFGFADLGMVNRKNGDPTVQWGLLQDFATGYGVLTWHSAGANRKNKKRREKLARDLAAFFRIDGDPFARHGNGWRTRFQIDPDR